VIYRIGQNRIVYQTKSFNTVEVTAYIYNPDLEQSELYTLSELEPGIYYLDYAFNRIGDYIMVTFENGIRSVGKVLKVDEVSKDYTLFWEGQPLL